MTPPPGPRRVQLFPVLAGLVFLVVAVLYLLQAGGAFRLESRVVLPLEVGGLVVAALLSSVYAGRSRSPRRDEIHESSDR